MKINFRKRYIKINLIFGILWIVFFILGIFIKDDFHWINYGYLLMAVLYSGLYIYQKERQYLLIEKGFIKYNRPNGKQVNLSEIKAIKKFAGDYILKSDKDDFRIDTQVIDPASLEDLNAALHKLEVDW